MEFDPAKPVAQWNFSCKTTRHVLDHKSKVIKEAKRQHYCRLIAKSDNI
jgi:hypothetical protein